MELLKSELIGKTLMDKEGFPIGIIRKCLINRDSEDPVSILVSPSKGIDIQKYESNSQGDIVIPLSSITPIKNVVILEKNLI
jgi:sporulation protein YlmC with PRC-barrel domain